ncbi:hypothetical protein OTU49_009996 [Cherax quadricarinatus]|uniref:C2H2-type domain-containing protein n=1 Tax=Cherax quadricarinatus TaxID=27406 RepID=A0AAW0WGX1_CHEQU
MVDWDTGNSKLHARRMHTVLEDSSSFLVGKMFQDDEVELNVMDFVETEYKPDKCDDKRIRRSLSVNSENYRQRTVKTDFKDSYGGTNERYNTRINSLQPTTNQIINRKKKKKSTLRPTLAVEQNNDVDISLHFPYATYLKSLCDEVGDVQSPMSDSFHSKIFDQLRRADVHYPYASLLEELHQSVEVKATNIPSTIEDTYQQESHELGIADVMRSLHHPTTVNENSKNVQDSHIESFDAPFSTMLLGMVMQQKIQDYARNHFNKVNTVGDFRGIGEVLKTYMPKSQSDDPPPSELHFSSLLQKFSLFAQDKVMQGTNSFHESSDEEHEQILLWSTSESSHSEDDDFEWKPTSWKAKQVTNVVNIPKKRKSKSRRKKKRVVKTDYSKSNVPSSSQNYFNCTGQKHSSYSGKAESDSNTSSAPSSRLLQLIMGNIQNTPEEPTIERPHKVLQTEEIKNIYRCNVRRSKRKAKRNNTPNYIEKDSINFKNKVQDNDDSLKCKQNKQLKEEVLSVSNSEAENNAVDNPPCSIKSSEPQSLLKEYLLKPAGEERIQTENCDIPKVETNFLFSRLLQNFKSLAESSHSDNSERRQSCTGPSILRGMLVGGNSNELDRINCTEEETQDKNNFIEHIDLSTIQECSSKDSLFESSGSVCKVKYEQDIKIEFEEDVLCKIECDEDNFECQVCHLQFSSVVDLSNHQILFHCNEDPQTSNSHKLLPCNVDGLQNNVLQEKLPA